MSYIFNQTEHKQCDILNKLSATKNSDISGSKSHYQHYKLIEWLLKTIDSSNFENSSKNITNRAIQRYFMSNTINYVC